MMKFNQKRNVFTATNSLMRVVIKKNRANQYMISTPDGRLHDDFTSAGPFVDFESAQHNAEMNVGIKMCWSITQ